MLEEPAGAGAAAPADMRALLCALPLFQGLSQAALDRVRSDFVPRRLGAGSTLFEKGDPGDGVYILLSGQLNGHVISTTGRELVLTTILPVRLFGELAVLDDLPRSLTISAVADSGLLHMPDGRFRKMLETEPRIALNLAAELGRRNRALNARVFGLFMHDVETRLCELLLRMAREAGQCHPGGVLEAAPTHEAIAAQVGANREAVSRAMSRLAGLGLIEARRRRIVLHDIKALSARVVE